MEEKYKCYEQKPVIAAVQEQICSRAVSFLEVQVS